MAVMMTSHMILIVAIGVTLGFVASLALWVRELRKMRSEVSPLVLEDLQPIKSALAQIPDKTVSKAVGRSSVERGSLGEMIAFLKLKADYDRVLPFHDVVDFIGIRFPRANQEGCIDFIDIKTGRARLTKEQIALRKMIQENRIGFHKVKLTVDDLIERDTSTHAD